MKKLIALLLSIAIALSFVIIPADASSYSDILGIDESQYDMALYYEHLWENYNHDMHGLLWEAVCDPQYYVYPQVVGEVGSDGWIEFASSVTDEQLTKERYIEILSNLLVMMDYNTKDLIAEQVNADSTKKLKDYVVDVTGILVQTVSLDAAFGSHVTKNMERIATAMDLTWGFADFTIDTIEIYESLDRTLRQYENHREFLSAIIQNTSNTTLKDAARELSEAADKAFFCKVNAVADTAYGLAGYLGQDVFFDTIVLEYMVTDASVLGISENDVAVLGVLKSAYEYIGTLQLATDLGVFAGDAIIGISDVMNRYNEMRALTDIRNALIQQMARYRDSIQNVGDAEKIGKLCSLMKNLIYVNFRGEYCAHEMSTHDAQLYSLIIKINGQAETNDRVYEQAKENAEMYSLFVDMIFPELEFYRFEDDAHTDESSIETFDSFEGVITDIQNRINYNGYTTSQKEYCRGNFFEVDGKNALVLMYHVLSGAELTPGYYVGLWVENSDGTSSCLTDQLIEEVGNPNDAYVTVNIRKIDEKMYLNPYVRKVNGNADISKNQYYLIGDELVLEYNLYSEGNNYYLNQEQIDQSAFYSTQDKLNIRTYILGLDPNWSEGLPPQGYTFEELLAQLPAGTTSNNSATNNSLTTELGLSADSAQAIVDVYVPFCQSLSDTYTSSDGSVAKQRSCLVVEFETGSPNLVVHYWIPNAYDPGQFCEAWIIYGIESGEVVELYSDENYAPTRREIDMVYDESYGFALREEQTGGYYELIIHYPTNVSDTAMYENYNYIQLPEESHILRAWSITGDYVDISF